MYLYTYIEVMPFRLTMLAQRAKYYLAKTPNTKHENPAGQGSPEDSQNNIGFCHWPCLLTFNSFKVSPYFWGYDALRHRTWKIKLDLASKPSPLRIAFHCNANCYADLWGKEPTQLWYLWLSGHSMASYPQGYNGDTYSYLSGNQKLSNWS